jgi:hypothetical protein
VKDLPKYNVIAEFIDTYSGERKMPGDIIEVNSDRANELKNVGVIGVELATPETKAEIEASIPVDEKAGESDEPKVNNPADRGTVKPGGSKKPSSKRS